MVILNELAHYFNKQGDMKLVLTKDKVMGFLIDAIDGHHCTSHMPCVEIYESIITNP